MRVSAVDAVLDIDRALSALEHDTPRIDDVRDGRHKRHAIIEDTIELAHLSNFDNAMVDTE